MPRLVWDQPLASRFETGVDKVVLYPKIGAGVVWNGVTTITESPTGAEVSSQYADNSRYVVLLSNEEFAGSIEAFTYPEEFEKCDGTYAALHGVLLHQQPRETFGLCYRTLVGDGLRGTDAGYKLHLVYNALATPSEDEYGTINDSPEAINFSWEFTSTPSYEPSAFKPSAYLTIDSTQIDAVTMQRLEKVLYGSSSTNARLPLMSEIISLLSVTDYTIMEDINEPGTFVGTAAYEDLQESGTFLRNSTVIREDSLEAGTFVFGGV